MQTKCTENLLTEIIPENFYSALSFELGRSGFGHSSQPLSPFPLL
jgi:hypothetical protein